MIRKFFKRITLLFLSLVLMSFMRPIGYAFEPVKENDVVYGVSDPGDYSEQDYVGDNDIYNVTESGNNSTQKVNFIPYT